jgi:hypothetical protein
MKVECAFLVATVCKSRCRIQTISQVHPCSTLNRAQTVCVTDGCAVIGLAVPYSRVDAGGKLLFPRSFLDLYLRTQHRVGSCGLFFPW